FHLVISDQRMPKMTGVEFFTLIKDLYPESIRMVLTGYSDMQAIIDSINKGNIYYYISKPWNAKELKVIIDNALEAYELRTRNRELEKENVLAQFEILKNQINPHFLFNSMNILSSLITQSPEKAIRFTHQFSKLYRSTLQLREQLLISLAEEMEFVNSYLFLQKIRFEDSLQLSIDIPQEVMQDAIPPFALQTVIENAIKHNIVSESMPLTIDISYADQSLLIKNKLQKRKHIQDSTGTGLSNLSLRYKLIGDLKPNFLEEAEYYIARLPIIPTN
ncbi:MAG: histidine kinase, partial [Bacteroidota bacterium]